MTREEYFKAIELGTGAASKANAMIKYIESLEQRIAELELQLSDANSYFDGVHTELEAPKSCEGCKYEMPTDMSIFINYCSTCLRDKGDYYEPKDKE